RQGRHDNGQPHLYRMPFMPTASISLTPFALGGEGPANRSIRGDKNSPAVGIYLIKNGDVVEEPGQMLLIKNDPNYNECWPRAVVPYERIYGIKEPRQ